MKSPEAVEMTPVDILETFQRLVTLRGTPEQKKSAKRIVYAIEELEGFGTNEVPGPQGMQLIPHFNLPKAEKMPEFMYLPISKADRIFLWDIIKADIANATIASERVIGRVARALGKRDEYETLIAATEPTEESNGKPEPASIKPKPKAKSRK